MKIESIERLLTDPYEAIWVCVKWEEPPTEEEYNNFVDYNMNCKAGQEILRFVNENDDDYFYYKEGDWISKTFYHAHFLSECGKFKNQEHWMLEADEPIKCEDKP